MQIAKRPFWAIQTQKIASFWRDDVEIQGRLANAASQVIVHSDISDPSNHWATTLRNIGEQHPTVPQIQALVEMGALNACAAISKRENGTTPKEQQFRPWIDSIVATLSPSGLSESAMIPLVVFALQRVLVDQSREFARLCFGLHQYWPGFMCDCLDSGKLVYLGDVIGSTPIFQRPEFESLMSEARELVQEREVVQQRASKVECGDSDTLRKVWNKRMFLPDRGDSLMPILKASNLGKEYEEGLNDPWRVEARWNQGRTSETVCSTVKSLQNLRS